MAVKYIEYELTPEVYYEAFDKEGNDKSTRAAAKLVFIDINGNRKVVIPGTGEAEALYADVAKNQAERAAQIAKDEAAKAGIVAAAPQNQPVGRVFTAPPAAKSQAEIDAQNKILEDNAKAEADKKALELEADAKDKEALIGTACVMADQTEGIYAYDPSGDKTLALVCVPKV